MTASAAIAVPSKRRWRWVKRAAAAGAVLLAACGIAFAAWVASLGSLPFEAARQTSITVVDRNGKLLRAFAMADGRWRLPVDPKPTSIPAIWRCCWPTWISVFTRTARRSEGAGARPYSS